MSCIDFEVKFFEDDYEGGSGWRIAYKDYDCVIGYTDEHLLFNTEREANNFLIRMISAGYQTVEDVSSMTDEVLAHIAENMNFDNEDIPKGSLVIDRSGHYGHTLADGKVHYFGVLPEYAKTILKKLGCLAIADDDAVDALNDTKVVIKVMTSEKEKFVL